MKQTTVLGILAISLLLGSCSKDDDTPDVPQPIADCTYTANGVSFKMIGVQGGTFMQGATEEQGSDAWDNEKPAHSVTVGSYSIGETEVTQELWEAVMGSNKSHFKGPKRPVDTVFDHECQEFITKLNAITGKKFRLPTESEWEYACRGGNKSKGYKYSGSNKLAEVAWYKNNSYDKGEDSPSFGTHAVATKKPNELGIYDMSGNVEEICEDIFHWYDSDILLWDHVSRGGDWVSDAVMCRCSSRSANGTNISSPGVGFRLAL